MSHDSQPEQKTKHERGLSVLLNLIIELASLIVRLAVETKPPKTTTTDFVLSATKYMKENKI